MSTTSRFVASVLAICAMLIALPGYLLAQTKVKEGQTLDIGNIKVTTVRGGNDALTNVVGVNGVGVVITIKFVLATGPQEAGVLVFRMNPEPEKSDITLNVGSTKIVPMMLTSPIEPPFSLYRMPAVGAEGHRMWFHFPSQAYSVSFLFDVPEKEINQEKVFSAKFKAQAGKDQSREVFLLVNLNGNAKNK